MLFLVRFALLSGLHSMQDDTIAQALSQAPIDPPGPVYTIHPHQHHSPTRAQTVHSHMSHATHSYSNTRPVSKVQHMESHPHYSLAKGGYLS